MLLALMLVVPVLMRVALMRVVPVLMQVPTQAAMTLQAALARTAGAEAGRMAVSRLQVVRRAR